MYEKFLEMPRAYTPREICDRTEYEERGEDVMHDLRRAAQGEPGRDTGQGQRVRPNAKARSMIVEGRSRAEKESERGGGSPMRQTGRQGVSLSRGRHHGAILSGDTIEVAERRLKSR